MSSPKKIAIVAALDREINSLVSSWRVCEKQYSGRAFRFFECENTVAVCGGVGGEAARRAAEAVIALYNPRLIYSAGFAGAADRALKIGDIVIPRRVIDARDGSSVDTENGDGILVSFAVIATPEQKAKLHDSYNAKAVDMEAAAVAKAATLHGVSFAAVKAISDERDFRLPPLGRFVDTNGAFRTASFALFLIFRPWIWSEVFRLQCNSAKAAHALCGWLRRREAETNSITGVKVFDRA